MSSTQGNSHPPVQPNSSSSRPSLPGTAAGAQPPPKVPCPWCHRQFTRRGLPIHQAKCRSSPSAPPAPNRASEPPGVPSHSGRPLQGRLLAACQETRVMRIVPRAVRPAVAEGLIGALDLVAANNDSSSWESLLSFPFVVLQLPVRSPTSTSLAATVRTSLKAFRDG